MIAHDHIYVNVLTERCTSDSSKIDAKGPAQPHGVALLQGFFRCLWQQEWQNRNAFVEQLQGLVG